MQKFFTLWVSILIFLIGGCGTKHYRVSEPKMITLKTPKIKFSDMGYVRYDEQSVEVELFTAGVAVEKISMDGEVCVSAGCMDEGKFVKEYLNSDYPSDTMRHIVMGKDIFLGQGKSEMCNGTLYQYIRNDEMDIVYRRKPTEIYFKDRLNGVLIKINDVNNSEVIP